MAKFTSIKVNKTLVIITSLLVILLILGAVSVALSQIEIEIPVQMGEEKSAPGINFDGKDVGELERSEIESLLKDLEEEYRCAGEDAFLDPVTRGVIPGLPESKLDIEQTTDKILQAEPGATVNAVYHSSPPEVSLADFLDAPIYQGNPDKEKVAFACNVAWGREHLPAMLQLFDDHDIEITFFLEGRWASNNEESVRTIYEHGHEIGNHGYHHYMMSELSKSEVKEEIVDTNQVIENVIEQEVELFAPPAGDFDEDVLRFAADEDLHTILWSVDTVDWQNPGVSYMEDKILTNVHPGAIVLMHPTEDTVTALETIIAGIRDQGLKVTSVSNLISEYDY